MENHGAIYKILAKKGNDLQLSTDYVVEVGKGKGSQMNHPIIANSNHRSVDPRSLSRSSYASGKENTHTRLIGSISGINTTLNSHLLLRTTPPIYVSQIFKMKASILLFAAFAGFALAQPASLSERDHTESPLCPWFSDDNPLQPAPACCYNVPWTNEHLPYKVCMARKIIP